ncbi:MAG: DUF6088 family protein [Flavobacteriales bacterium]
MKTTDYISNKIDRLPKGYVFTYEDFITEVNKKEGIIKALNRMATSSKINKLSKGRFYKPETTVFGELAPSQYQVVKDMLESNGKVTGYLTGYSIYNQLGLTRQISNTIQIGKNEIRPAFKRERYTISFIKQKNTITKENIPFLQILDALRYIKKIPDATIESSCKRFIVILNEFKEAELKTIARLSQKYPPSTRALLGAFLDELKNENYTKLLRDSLNPITKYTLKGISKVLTTSENWNIE